LKSSENPADLQASLDLALYLIEKGRLEDSIEPLLSIIKRDKTFQEKIAHTTLMDVFKKLGNTNDAVRQGRKKLTSMMF
jgi:putative thioredoxin